MSSPETQQLPVALLETQLSTIDLLSAMYPDELEIPESTSQTISRLRSLCQDPSSPQPLPPSLYIVVSLPIPEEESPIQVTVTVPLSATTPSSTLDVAPPPVYSLRQPSWLSKAEVAEIASSIPSSEDTLEVFESITASAAQISERKKAPIPAELATGTPPAPIVRVWFYFPSLSTRKKRDDMVSFAPRYGLSGFVLAGKPGVLCLEGVAGDIDEYMGFIKTHSWGDIPSYQKKVSERFRETGVERVFGGMEEITDSLGERGGQRANRGDMQALEGWLAGRGLREAFENVIF